ncbi:MAG: hypothetical protein K9K65_01810 [Desulfarculaceae bacterium]|nr:hypothetical protein [Desulfarculaceae bacterium]MCF8047326.1 hypothetical protein [Desulfarculaceae bacterium]MCF8063875.1 hypothetical protein [Desulfarculaceae bacterium]MCF8096553.1 hypothetical protein [Desulfarculaceae bacterium]MCF8122109.1 hypothetical protein [Desulfarculaceae bacterium]
MRPAQAHSPQRFSSLVRLWRGQSGAVAALAAFLLTALVGITGAAVDLGLLYSTKGELQNAADAAALAGAATMVSFGENGEISVQPITAVTTAQQVSLANQAHGVNLTLRSEDAVIGYWDTAANAFDPGLSGSSDPDDITGFKATLRRDELANGPVETFFAGLVGYGSVGVQATSTAFLGWAGLAEPMAVDLPLAIHASALTNAGSPDCGSELLFNNENNETAEWTSFFTWPTNDVTVRDYAEGTQQSPELKVGDSLNVINGNLSTATMNTLSDLFQAQGSDTDGDGAADSWEVLVPVVEPGGSSTVSTVVGFAHLVITEADSSKVRFYLQCDRALIGSNSGGGNYGTRATVPSLIQ